MCTDRSVDRTTTKTAVSHNVKFDSRFEDTNFYLKYILPFLPSPPLPDIRVHLDGS